MILKKFGSDLKMIKKLEIKFSLIRMKFLFIKN